MYATYNYTIYMLEDGFMRKAQLLEYWTVQYTSGKPNLDINALITRYYTQRSVARYQLHQDLSSFKDVIQEYSLPTATINKM